MYCGIFSLGYLNEKCLLTSNHLDYDIEVNTMNYTKDVHVLKNFGSKTSTAGNATLSCEQANRKLSFTFLHS